MRMRKKVIYLGASIIIFGIVLVLMGIFVMSDTGLFLMSGNYGAINNILLIKTIMNWLGIILSISGAVIIIAGVTLDEQVQTASSKSNPINHPVEEFHTMRKEEQQQTAKTSYCFQCGAELEGSPSYCYGCGTKLR
jgi:uncharacterized membrane protein